MILSWYSIPIMRCLALAILAIGIGVVPAEKGPGKPEQRITQNSKASGSKKATVPKRNQQPPENIAIDRLLSVIQTQQQQNSQASQDQERQTTQDAEIQRRLAGYTRALVYVGGLQSVILLLTVFVIYLQVATTREIERALVLGDDIGKLPDIPKDTGKLEILWIHLPSKQLRKDRGPN